MVEKGIIDKEKYPLSERWKNDLSWDNNPDKIWDARAMAVHAAMVDRMDQGIGRIIQALEETGEMDNTLILFLSDNGASPEDCMRYGPGFDRPSHTRSGEEIKYPVDKNLDALPGPQTTFTSIGERWANVANTPFRYWKMKSYEGGIHTPMIVHWPQGIKAKKGSVTDQVGHVMDFMATFIELANTAYPSQYQGYEITPLQGISLLDVFEGEERAGHKVLFNEHMGGRYVRRDPWKLVALDSKESWKLYHITDDRTEIKNLAGQHSKVMQELDSLWQNWAVNHQVLVPTEQP
jgi:arylsulfatase